MGVASVRSAPGFVAALHVERGGRLLRAASRPPGEGGLLGRGLDAVLLLHVVIQGAVQKRETIEVNYQAKTE